MNPKTQQGVDERESELFLFLFTASLITISGFGLYYHLVVGSRTLTYTCISLFFLFINYGGIFYFFNNVSLAFRLSVVTIGIAFYLQVFYTGGIYSPSLPVFIVPAIITFFYRPSRDRFLFMGFSFLAILSFWPLTSLGFVRNELSEEHYFSAHLINAIFVFAIVMIFAFLYKNAFEKKNKKLKNSLEDLKKTTHKLIQSEKMASLGVMSAGVAHEINNPLNFIKGGIEVLTEKLKDSSEHGPFLRAIEEGVKRASSIVSSMGNFSRSTSSMEEECDLQKIVDNCLIMMQHRLKYKVKVVKNYSASNYIRVVGNEGKLHQAILNILSNAEQAIENIGTITIETKVKPNHLRLTISDNGVGINEENLDKISDPFFTTKPAGTGTGLGLAITYKIIQEHNAKIMVSSAPGFGTDFTILFEIDDRFKQTPSVRSKEAAY